MADQILYNLVIPQQAQLSQGARQQRQNVTEGTLQAGPATVTSIKSEPGEKTLVGRVSGRHAKLKADEFEELFSNSAIDVVPLFTPGSATSRRDRYVALENVSTEPAHPVDDRVQRFDGALANKGSKRSHRRAVATNPTTEDNPFESDSAEEIGIPARAQKVKWWDDTAGTLESDPDPVRNVEGEHDRIEVYDATDSSIADPTLLYDVPYRYEWPVDVRVWDDYDRSQEDTQTVGSTTVGSATVGSATVSETRTALQWQRVFATDHDYSGTPILENDLLRLVIDEAAGRIKAHEWDSDDQYYRRIALGNSPWRLWDLNIRRIGVERVDAQVEFEDLNDPGTTHNLNMSLKRGWESVLWTVPANEDPAPQGLVDRLAPIAATTEQDPAAQATLVERQEVDR